MVNVVRSERPYRVLDAAEVERAIGVLGDGLSGVEAKSEAARLHQTIAGPLGKALAEHAVPKLALSVTHPKKDGREIHLLELGGKLFPLVTREAGWGEREITVFPPIGAKTKIDADAIAKHGVEAIYGKPAKEVDAIGLKHGQTATAYGVYFNWGNRADVELGYARALWDAAACSLEKALAGRKPAAPPDAAAVAAAVAGPGKKVETLLDVLKALPAKAPASGGPPIGHDLLDAFSWGGRPIAITSQRQGDQPIHVWLQEKVDGKAAWKELAPPPGAVAGGKFPCRGASALLEGNQLHIYGGLDAKGEVLRSHWIYDLAKGARDGHGADAWRVGTPLAEGVAWPVVAATARDTFVIGGVAGYYLSGASSGAPAVKNPHHRKSMEVAQRDKWATRSAPPAAVTGASVATDRDCVFVGPGTERDGKVYLYDTAEGGAWYKLPDLPGELGLGQLHRVGSALLYTGGFDAQGEASKAIYRIDLDGEPKWSKVGESDYVAGKARLVNADGRMVALMVTPDASRCFHLS